MRVRESRILVTPLFLSALFFSAMTLRTFAFTSGLQDAIPKDPDKGNFSMTHVGYGITSLNDCELVIGFNNSSQHFPELLGFVAERQGKVVNSVKIGNRSALVVCIQPKDAASFISETSGLEFVEYVEPNSKFRLTWAPNDPLWGIQWGPQKIEAEWAWNKTVGNTSLIVAVIDTGVDWDHPDLAANYVPLGYDWVNNDTDPMDDNGHGTHVAGIIAAVLNNSLGIAGLAQVSVMVEKCFNSTGWGDEDDCANAIIHAVDQGASILSLSWGDYFNSSLVQYAIEHAYSQDVLIVAAAGNDGVSERIYPAAYDEVIAVTAAEYDDQPASFTNFGNWVELAAPGVDIYSTYPDDGYAYMGGTSMACPHVTGVAALIWSYFPNMTRDEVRFQLQRTADDLGSPSYDYYYGYGRINARKALTDFSHDLSVSLYAPKSVITGKTVTLNITTFNNGICEENNIDVQILVNDTVKYSQTIVSLAPRSYKGFNFSWLPEKGVFNVTAYVSPATEEENMEDNAISQFTVVGSTIINPKLGDYSNYKIEIDEDTVTQIGEINFTYEELLTEQFLRISVDSVNISSIGETAWAVIDSVTKLVDSGPSWWIGDFYFQLMETTAVFGDTVDLFKGKGVVVGEYDLTIGNRTYSTWLVGYSGETLPFNNFANHYCYFDKTTGLLVKWVSTSATQNPQTSFPFTMTIVETNVDSTPPSITITNPKHNSFLNNTSVTVQWNAGDNETGVEGYSIYLDGEFIGNSTGSSFLLSNLTEGINLIKITAFDIAGNTASNQVTVTVDLTNPVVDILSPLNGFTTNATILEPTWIGTDNQTGIANYKLYVNDTLVANTTSTAFVLTNLEEGKSFISVVVYDMSGNKANSTVTIIVDRTTPEVSILSLEEKNVVRGIMPIVFEVSQDAVQVFLFIDDVSFNVSGLFLKEWNSLEVGNGGHVVRVLAVDEAGNVGERMVVVTVANVQNLVGFREFLQDLTLIATISVVVAVLVLVLALTFFMLSRHWRKTG